MNQNRCILKTETLTLVEKRNGFWLYDSTQGMNLSMEAETAEAAYIETIQYYQKRLTEVENAYSELNGKVEAFVSQFQDDDDDDDER